MKLITSSGGVGDMLIVACKVMGRFYSPFSWHHFERHACHLNALQDLAEIMRHSDIYCRVHIEDDPYGKAREMVGLKRSLPAVDEEGPLGHYVSSSCKDMGNPYLHSNFVMTIRDVAKIEMAYDICILKQAGRMGDSTRREVSNAAIEQIADAFPNASVVVIGPEQAKLPTLSNVHDLTGRTSSIIEAMALVSRCKLFIGQDGALAYYALMLGKPTVVNYHDSALIRHYWHSAWWNHAIPLSFGNVMDPLSREFLEKHVRSIVRA